MRTKASVSVGIGFSVGVMLLLGSGCARWINGNGGEKDMQSGRGHQGREVEVALEHGQQKATDEMPSLSQSLRSESFNVGNSSREERIPNDLVVVSPSTLSGGHRGPYYGDGLSAQERQQGERLAALAGLEDIFFGYDSSTVSNAARERLLHAAQWLRRDSKNTLMIEGHCDERGTNDYNFVLGEKRARAVLNFLRDQRLDGNRLMVVSYGKERPFCRAHDESCYQQNRRGHLIVRH